MTTGPGTERALSMDAADGELLEARGNLTLSVAELFEVTGDFAFVQKSGTVTLSDGSTVDTDMITVGANAVSAFAGVSGIGLQLADADFALVLLSDADNPARRWMALQSEVGSVAFVGVDGLTVEADTLAVEVNRNLSTEGAPIAQPDVLTATVLQLDLSLTAGTLTFALEGEESAVEVAAGDTDAGLRDRLRAGLEALAAVGTGNVLVEGTRAGGFTLTFQGDLLGEDLSALRVEASPAPVSGSVRDRANGQAAATGVTTTVQTLDTQLFLQADLPAGSLTFLLRGESSPSVSLSPETTDSTLRSDLAAALASLTPIGSTAPVTVSGTRADGFTLTFGNELSGQDFSDLQLVAQRPGIFTSVTTLVPGSTTVEESGTSGSNVRERQVVAITSVGASGPRDYYLSFDGETTGRIPYSPSSVSYNRAKLTAALEALPNLGAGEFRVAFDSTSTAALPRFFVTFTGDLAYTDVPLLAVESTTRVTVATSVDREGQAATSSFTTTEVEAVQEFSVETENPGTYTLALAVDGTTYTTAPLAFGAGAGAIATALDTALAPTGGTVAVVSPSAQTFRVTFQGELAGRDLPLLRIEPELGAVSAGLQVLQRGLTQTESTTRDLPALDEVQEITITTEGAGTFRLVLTQDGTTYTTAPLATGVSAADLQAALESAFGAVAGAAFAVESTRPGQYLVTFAGSLAAQDWNRFQLRIEPEAVDASLDLVQAGAVVAQPDLIPDPDPDTVVDFAVAPLEVRTGPTTTLTLTLDGVDGSLARATGNLTLEAFDFFRVSGGFAFESSTETVTLSDGTTVETDLLTAGGGGVSAFVGVDAGTPGAIGFSTEELDFALALFAEKDGDRAWTALQADLTAAGLVGIDPLTLTVENLALRINRAAADGTVVDFAGSPLTVLTGPATSLDLTLDGADGEQLVLRGDLGFGVAGFVTLDGSFAFSRTEVDGAETLVAVGEGVAASLSAGEAASVAVTGANFGFLRNATDLAFELSGGSVDASIANFADFGATAILVQYTDAATVVPAGTQLSVLDLSYTFGEEIAADTQAFGVEGFTAEVGGFVELSGDLAFRQVGEDIEAVGADLSASLSAGPASLAVEGASFGLLLDALGGVVFGLHGTSLTANLPPLATVTATGISVRYASGGAVTAGRSLTIGTTSFTFAADIADGDRVFSVTGFTASLGGVVEFSGDSEFALDEDEQLTTTLDGTLDLNGFLVASGTYQLTYEPASGEIRVAGVGIGFDVDAGGTDLLTFSDGEGALLVTDAGVAGRLSGDLSLLGSVPGVTVSATGFTARFNTIDAMVAETLPVGSGTVDLNLPAGPFLSLEATGASIGFAGVTLQGGVAFQRQVVGDGAGGTEEVLTVAFRDVELVGGFSGEGTGGSGLSVEDAEGVFVIVAGSGMAGKLEFTASIALPGIDAGTRVSLFINDLGEAVVVDGTLVSLNLPATGPNGATLWVEAALAFDMPGIEISGTFGYAGGSSTWIVGTEIEAFVGDNVSGRTGLSLVGGTGFLLQDDSGAITAEITGTVSVVGVPGLTASSLMTLRYNAATAAVDETYTIAGEAIALAFAADEVGDGTTPFVEVLATGTTLDLGGVFTVGGDFTFTRTTGALTVTASGAEARLGAEGGAAVQVENAEAAVRVDTLEGDYSLYASGDASLAGLPALSLGGTLAAWANTSGEQAVDFGGGIGTVDYGTSGEYYAFRGSGLELSVADFATLSGNFTGGARGGGGPPQRQRDRGDPRGGPGGAVGERGRFRAAPPRERLRPARGGDGRPRRAAGGDPRGDARGGREHHGEPGGGLRGLRHDRLRDGRGAGRLPGERADPGDRGLRQLHRGPQRGPRDGGRRGPAPPHRGQPGRLPRGRRGLRGPERGLLRGARHEWGERGGLRARGGGDGRAQRGAGGDPRGHAGGLGEHHGGAGRGLRGLRDGRLRDGRRALRLPGERPDPRGGRLRGNLRHPRLRQERQPDRRDRGGDRRGPRPDGLGLRPGERGRLRAGPRRHRLRFRDERGQPRGGPRAARGGHRRGGECPLHERGHHPRRPDPLGGRDRLHFRRFP